MIISNALLIAAAALGAMSFVFLFRSASRERDQWALVRAYKSGALVNAAIAVLVGFLVLGPVEFRPYAAMTMLLALITLTWSQRLRLLGKGARRQFVNRYLMISGGFILALVAFSGAMILGA